MKKLLAVLAATVGFGLLPSVSQAECAIFRVRIVRVFVHAFGGLADITARSGGSPNANTYNFLTVDPTRLNAALVAQAAQQAVDLFGSGDCDPGGSGGFLTGIRVTSLP